MQAYRVYLVANVQNNSFVRGRMIVSYFLKKHAGLFCSDTLNRLPHNEHSKQRGLDAETEETPVDDDVTNDVINDVGRS